MTMINCNCRCRCVIAAVAAAIVIGVLTAFFQITGIITVTPVFLWVVFGVGVVYLAVLVAGAGIQPEERCACRCEALGTLLAGLLGSIALAVVLLAVGIVATSVVSAILAGLLLFFFTLVFTGAACYVRCASECGS